MWSTVRDQVEFIVICSYGLISHYKDLEKIRIPCGIDSLFCREIEMAGEILLEIPVHKTRPIKSKFLKLKCRHFKKLFYSSSGDSNVQEQFTVNIPHFAGDVKGKCEQL